MATDQPGELPVIDPTAAPCRHLRNKGMYVYGDGSGGQVHEDYDNSIYWCLRSMTGYGPDDELVGGAECRDPSRSCYEPL